MRSIISGRSRSPVFRQGLQHEAGVRIVLGELIKVYNFIHPKVEETHSHARIEDYKKDAIKKFEYLLEIP